MAHQKSTDTVNTQKLGRFLLGTEGFMFQMEHVLRGAFHGAQFSQNFKTSKDSILGNKSFS